MKFYDIKQRQPTKGQWCIIKEKINNGKAVDVFQQPQQFFEETEFTGHSGVVSWAPVPQHALENWRGWKSEYRGDDLPKKSCQCLVCFDNNRMWDVRIAYYHTGLGRFVGLGQREVIAYMEIQGGRP